MCIPPPSLRHWIILLLLFSIKFHHVLHVLDPPISPLQQLYLRLMFLLLIELHPVYSHKGCTALSSAMLAIAPKGNDRVIRTVSLARHTLAKDGVNKSHPITVEYHT